MSIQEKNKELMITLDNAWNSQDWDTFNERHDDNVAVFWPGQADPTRGVHNHCEDYKILIAQGDYTCSVADFTGTFKGAMKGLDGKMIQPTNKKFHLDFCTVAHWKDGKILEERLFYDQVGMLKQIGAIQ
jgi:ketosteroid isomerase-like protein